MGFLLGELVLVGATIDDRRRDEVVLGRWRGRPPLERPGEPRVPPGALAVAERYEEVHDREEERAREQERAAGGEHVEELVLRRIAVIAPGHAPVAEEELRDERQDEPEEHRGRGQ